MEKETSEGWPDREARDSQHWHFLLGIDTKKQIQFILPPHFHLIWFAFYENFNAIVRELQTVTAQFNSCGSWNWETRKRFAARVLSTNDISGEKMMDILFVCRIPGRPSTCFKHGPVCSDLTVSRDHNSLWAISGVWGTCCKETAVASLKLEGIWYCLSVYPFPPFTVIV